jgi:ubiquinone/menaquinone biosynthesis C-methylase UbiE
MPQSNPTQPIQNFLDPREIIKLLDIKEGMVIADFGAGSGYKTFEAAKLVGQGKGMVYALDVKKSVIEHIKGEMKRKNISNIKPIWTDLEIPGRNHITPHSVDMVLIVNMLYQSIKHHNILEEAARILKPGGKIVIIDWISGNTPFGPSIDERVNLEKIKQIAYNLELNKIKEFQAGQYHFGVIFRK